FDQVTLEVPESSEGSGQAQEKLALARGLELVHGHSQIVVLRIHALEPLPGASAAQIRLRLLGEGQEMLPVPPAHFVGLARLPKPLGRVLADRLEHPVTRREPGLALAEQALVEERLERVRIGAGNLLCGLVRASASEGREASE